MKLKNRNFRIKMLFALAYFAGSLLSAQTATTSWSGWMKGGGILGGVAANNNFIVVGGETLELGLWRPVAGRLHLGPQLGYQRFSDIAGIPFGVTAGLGPAVEGQKSGIASIGLGYNAAWDAGRAQAAGYQVLGGSFVHLNWGRAYLIEGKGFWLWEIGYRLQNHALRFEESGRSWRSASVYHLLSLRMGILLEKK